MVGGVPGDHVLRLPLILVATAQLTSGCHTLSRCADDAGCAQDSDADTDADTDSAHEDTSIGLAFHVADWQTASGAFVGGHAGTVVTDQDLSTVCTALAEWSESGAAPAGCPECEWAFKLTLSAGVATGAACASLGLSDDEWDGTRASIGYASVYEYDYNGIAYSVIEPVVWYYLEAYGWEPRVVGELTGNAQDLHFSEFYGYVYYY